MIVIGVPFIDENPFNFMYDSLEDWMNYLPSSENEILPSNYASLRKHIRRMKVRDKTKENHIQSLTPFAIWAKKPFEELTEDDLLDYSDVLDAHTYEVRGIEKKYSTSSRYTKLSTIKVFLKNMNPAGAETINMEDRHGKKLPEDILSKADI